jgi:hypothetical protein
VGRKITVRMGGVNGKGAGIRWRPSFINTHSTGLLSINLSKGRLLFVKIPPSFTKEPVLSLTKERGLGG